MAAKVILVLCAQALFIQAALCQCLGHAATGAWGAGALEGAGLTTLGWEASGLAGPGWENNGWAGNGCGGNGWAGNGWAGNGLAVNGLAGNGWAGAGFGVPSIEIAATSGGALPISSASAIAPVGISVASENVYEGLLTVAGELPFVSAVGLEAVLPSGGAGVVNHACGNRVGIYNENIAPAAYGIAGAYGPAATAYAPATAGILGYGNRGCGCGLY